MMKIYPECNELKEGIVIDIRTEGRFAVHSFIISIHLSLVARKPVFEIMYTPENLDLERLLSMQGKQKVLQICTYAFRINMYAKRRFFS